MACSDGKITPDTPPRGRLIVFEGLDGVGKTTQARLLAAALTASGREVILTREPTDGPHGRLIRALAARERAARDPAREVELFQADRRRHVADVIAPALARGAVVICDRYYYSTMAYQGALGLDPEAVRAANEAFAPRPHLVILLTLPLADLRLRLARRARGYDAFEQEDYLKRVAVIYAGLTDPWIVRCDTRRPEAAVHADLLALVQPHLDP